jgi:hypothetical protein
MELNMAWYKVLTVDGCSLGNESVRWPVKESCMGDYLFVTGQGTWLTSTPIPFLKQGLRAFEAEYCGPILTRYESIIWVSQVRLKRELADTSSLYLSENLSRMQLIK